MTLGVVVMSTAALTTGCLVTTIDGSPTAYPAPTPSTGQSSDERPRVPRPAVLDVTGRNTCTTIPDDVLRSTGYSPSKLGEDQTGATEFGCSFRDINGIDGSALFFDASKGYEQYRSSIGSVVKETTVAGFRAYAVQDQQLGGCTVGVDIADSQSLAVTRTGSQSEPVAPLCDRAADFAAAAIAALQSR